VLGPTIDAVLAKQAERHPDRVFLRFATGDVTFAEAEQRSARLAAGLASIGVAPGEVVPVLLDNSVEFVLTWLALCRVGAAGCLVNTALKGPALQHAIESSAGRLIVVNASTATNVTSVLDNLPDIEAYVTVGDDVPDLAGRHRHGWSDLAARVGAESVPPPTDRSATDTAMVLFTSGTTGVSKGCMLSHRYTLRQAQLMVEHLRLTSDDVLYCPFPLFHLDALVLTVGPALVRGATAAIGERFSVSGFWPEVRRFGATVFDFMGATLTMLHKQPPVADDADNPVRLAWGVPVPEFAGEFEQRFGLQLVELYGSTDAGLPIYHPIDEPRRPGSCGKVIDAYQVRLAGPDGFEVPVGEVGEILVRPNEPSLMADGYLGMPAATLAVRRDLWFHTGDLARRDADGYHFFVGRRSDTIRRRGENISAFEVEEVVKLHPDVLDAAAYGVPSELTEDDVMVAVVPRPGCAIDPAALVAFCAERAARHMLPRYVDVVADLPRTPTEKIRKELLRARGVTAATWVRPDDR
jgi:crotonobetaine/carnitine-CoA ligase